MRTLIVRLAVCALALAGASAQAYVMTLQPQSDTAAKIANATSGSVSIATYSVSSGRLLIETGAVAADISRDLAYFVVNPDPLLARGAKPQIRVFAYGSTYAGPPGVVDAPAGRYFGGVYYDAAATRLIGWLHDATTTAAPAPLQLFKLATSSGTALVLANRYGVSAGANVIGALEATWLPQPASVSAETQAAASAARCRTGRMGFSLFPG